MNLSNVSFEITKEVYLKFTSLSGDTHKLHTSKNFAVSKGFPDIVVQGNLLNCFLSKIVGVHLGLTDVMIINQNINYRKPIFLGDQLTFVLDVKEELEFLPGVELRYKCKRQNETVANGTILIKTML